MTLSLDSGSAPRRAAPRSMKPGGEQPLIRRWRLQGEQRDEDRHVEDACLGRQIGAVSTVLARTGSATWPRSEAAMCVSTTLEVVPNVVLS